MIYMADPDDDNNILNRVMSRSGSSGGSGIGKTIGTIIKIFAVVLVLLVLSGCTVQIDPGHEGVVVNQVQGGVQPVSMTPGMHFKMPFIEEVIPMETRIQKIEKTTSASSSDMQDVSASIAVNYHLNNGAAPTVYTTIGMDYSDRVIIPAIDESTKAATAKYTAAQLITDRPSVKANITDTLTKRLIVYSITVDQVSITNFNFSPAYTQAIEQKQIAEQDSEKAKNELIKAQIDAQQTVVQAEAQANATKASGDAQAYAVERMGQALKNNPDVAQIKWIEKWNGELPFYMTSDSSGNLMMVDTSTTSK
jgi:regulator of protease activity HflC (stomatin/prohibitin superfamily)